MQTHDFYALAVINSFPLFNVSFPLPKQESALCFKRMVGNQRKSCAWHDPQSIYSAGAFKICCSAGSLLLGHRMGQDRNVEVLQQGIKAQVVIKKINCVK